MDSINNNKILTLHKKWLSQEANLDRNERKKRDAEKKKNLKKNCKEEREKVWRILIN